MAIPEIQEFNGFFVWIKRRAGEKVAIEARTDDVALKEGVSDQPFKGGPIRHAQRLAASIQSAAETYAELFEKSLTEAIGEETEKGPIKHAAPPPNENANLKGPIKHIAPPPNENASPPIGQWYNEHSAMGANASPRKGSPIIRAGVEIVARAQFSNAAQFPGLYVPSSVGKIEGMPTDAIFLAPRLSFIEARDWITDTKDGAEWAADATWMFMAWQEFSRKGAAIEFSLQTREE